MPSYQTFPQADETKQSPGKKPSMIAALVPAPHHSDGATALAAGLVVPALAALAL